MNFLPIHLAVVQKIGRQQNRSRYEFFWLAINWQLPDAVLAKIWRVDRGNFRSLRVQLGQLKPKWRVTQDRLSPVFQAAVALEKLKARKFTGPKPFGNQPDWKEAKHMNIPTEMSLEIVQRRGDGNVLLDLNIRLIGSAGHHLSADIDAEDGLVRPRIIAASDSLGLDTVDREALTIAALNHMRRYFGDGPTGGTVKWARWVEADLTPWLQQVLYRPAAARITRALGAMSPGAGVVARSFTESLEV